ncbi:MAG: hypothetical protein IKG81_16270 [Bacteroidales bacterium]|nr:hypothetical protein [Bacteroidales bacterium]
MKKTILLLLLCPLLHCGCKDDRDPNNPFKHTTWKSELDGNVTLTLHFDEDTCTLKAMDGDYNATYRNKYTCYKDSKTTWDAWNQRYTTVLIDCVKFEQFDIYYTNHLIHDDCRNPVHNIEIHYGRIINDTLSLNLTVHHLPTNTPPYGHVITASTIWVFNRVKKNCWWQSVDNATEKSTPRR